MANPFTYAETSLSNEDVVERPLPFTNRNGSAQSRTIRFSAFVLFVALVLVAGVSKTQGQVFNQNEKLVGGLSPTIVPWDWDITAIPAPNSPLLVTDPVYIVYGIGVNAGNPNPVSVAINLPASFALTSAPRCLKFNGPTNPPVAGGTLSVANCTTTSITVGPMSQPNDKVIAIYDGYFTQAGAYSATFTPSVGGLALVNEQKVLSMNPQISNLTVDIGITKQVKPKTSGAFGSTATVAIYPNPGTLTYKLTVKNLSPPDPVYHTTDVYLGKLFSLWDKLSSPGTNDVVLNVSVSGFACIPSSGAVDCPTMPGGALSFVFPPNQGNSLTLPAITYPSTGVGSPGFLPAGSSFDITFDATISTPSVCSPINSNKTENDAFFTYSNGTTTIYDTNSSNDTAVQTTASLPVPGLPTTCPPPLGIQMTKTLVSGGGWSPNTLHYLITIKNTNSVTLNGLMLTDQVRSNILNTAFTATPSNVVCSPACNGVPVKYTPLVGVGSQWNLFTASFQALAPNAVQSVDYDVQYAAPCATSSATGSITNIAGVSGPVSGSNSITTPMPQLPTCQLQVTKTENPVLPPFSSFPATLHYQVKFKNNAAQPLTVYTLIDAMALDTPLYATSMDIAYLYTCTASGVTGATPLSYTSSGQPNIQPTNPIWAGTKLIDFSSATGVLFAPFGTLTCDLTVTLKQPPTTDSLCQEAGITDAVNFAFMDLAYPYNTNLLPPPVFFSKVVKALPKCVSIVAGKMVSPNVVAGSPVTFTLTLHNAGNNSTPTNINLLDTLPTGFTFVSWGCPNTTCTSTGSGFVTLQPIPGGGTATVLLNAIAPSVPGVYCNRVDATFNPFPQLTYFEGNQAQLTTASACVQVNPPTPPKLDKRLTPNPATIGQPVTVVFTITNGAGQPAQSGLTFSDVLPNPPFTLATLQSNTCGGTVSVNGNIVTLQNGTVPAGPSQCSLVFQAVPTKCGVFTNDEKNIHESTGLNYQDLNAGLTVSCEEFPKPKLKKEFSPTTISLGQPVKVVFTLTNPSGAGAQSGLGFTDTLPSPPFTNGTVFSNSCGGNATVSGPNLSLQNASLPTGPSQCTVVFLMAAPTQCGNVFNTRDNIHEATGVDYSGLSAELSVKCINPCCPPWNIDLLKEMMIYQPSGAMWGPYTLKFQPTPTFKNQMQAYINYLHSVNPLITEITIAFRLHYQGTGSFPYGYWGQQIPPTAFVKWTWNTTGIGSPVISPSTGFFVQPAYPPFPMQVGTWYAVTTGIFLNSPQTFFSDKCAEVTIYSRVPAMDTKTRSEPVLEFSDGKRVIETVPIRRSKPD